MLMINNNKYTLGGHMNNNVVSALHRYFVSQGHVVIRLNFRGCGNSKGRTSWTGMAERDDYQAVIDHVLHSPEYAAKYPRPSRLLICGYSYGGMIASSIDAPDSLECFYVLISYPLSVTWALSLFKASFFRTQATKLLDHYKQTTQGGVLVIYGDRDQFTSSKSYERWLEGRTGGHVRAEMVKGADHLWFDYEQLLVTIVDKWLNEKQ
ncbi:Alpha/Beta hydrolase protein [Phycomyces nitens]|nr:Alpha/Beta hydrolase protein [Phycomyces nitens]